MIRSTMIEELAFPIDEVLETYMVALHKPDKRTLNEMNANMSRIAKKFTDGLKKGGKGEAYLYADQTVLVESRKLNNGKLTMPDFIRAILHPNGGYIGQTKNPANRKQNQHFAGGVRLVAINGLPDQEGSKDTEFCEAMLYRLLNFENPKLYRKLKDGDTPKFQNAEAILMRQWSLQEHKDFALYLLVQAYEKAKGNRTVP